MVVFSRSFDPQAIQVPLQTALRRNSNSGRLAKEQNAKVLGEVGLSNLLYVHWDHPHFKILPSFNVDICNMIYH